MGVGENFRCSGTFVETLLLRRSLHIILIAVLGVIVYSNSLHGQFVFDDRSSILNNPVIKDLGNFLWNSTGYEYNRQRFIGYFSFAVNYRIGRLNVTGYHFVNLIIHIINSILVYTLVLLTFRTPFLKAADRPPLAQLIALFAALLFVAHPIQTQAVTYIVQRLTSLMTLFYLLAVTLYARMRVAEEGPLWKQIGYYIGTVTSVVLAMKTKENAFTLPLSIALYEWFFFSGAAARRLLRLVPFLATMIIIPLGMIDIHKPVGAILSDVNDVTQVQSLLTRSDYFFTQLRVIVTYLRLLFFPVNQNLDYDYPAYHSFFQAPVFGSFLILLALIIGAIYLLKRSRSVDPELRLVSFGIFWFFLALAVESSIIPIVDVIYEHRAYLPSAGMFIATSAFFVSFARRFQGKYSRKLALYTAMAVVVILGCATFQRNNIWASNVMLWQDVVRKSPGKARGYNNLGAAFTDAGQNGEAIKALQQALVLNPMHTEAYYNLGRVYLFYPDRLGDAISAFRKAIELRPDYDDAYVNLAAAYIKAGNAVEAIRLTETVLAKGEAERPDAHFNLGVAYSMVGNIQGALRETAILKKLDPQLADQLESFINQSHG
jgi:tetratricopeptide (TPR) repeat protein